MVNTAVYGGLNNDYLFRFVFCSQRPKARPCTPELPTRGKFAHTISSFDPNSTTAPRTHYRAGWSRWSRQRSTLATPCTCRTISQRSTSPYPGGSTAASFASNLRVLGTCPSRSWKRSSCLSCLSPSKSARGVEETLAIWVPVGSSQRVHFYAVLDRSKHIFVLMHF